MEAEKFDRLTTNAAAALELQHSRTLMEKLQARAAVEQEVSRMKAIGEAYELSGEEIRLLTEFRKFKATCKNGAVFSWQTRRTEETIVHTDTSLIVDPQNVSR